jgi:hypothetical protein
MWTSKDLSVAIEVAEGNEILAVIITPAGAVQILGASRVWIAFFEWIVLISTILDPAPLGAPV